MNMTLKLTNKEVEKLINNRLENDRFKIIFNDIPFYHPDHEPEKGETHRDYVEDDQREYRWLIFTDVSTGLEHCINYTYNPEWPNDLIELPKSIQIVNKEEDSDIYVKPVPIVNVEKPLTLEAQADKELWQRYQKMKHECKKVSPKEKIKVPKNRIDEILNLLKTKSFNMYQLRAVVIPVCIEYKLEDVTFWHWIQLKTSKGLKATSVVNKKYKLETETEKLWKEYIKIKDQCFKIEKNEKLLIPRNEIKPVIDFINGDKEFHIDDLRKMTIPLCIKYKFEDESFLSWLSEKAYSWKK